MKKTLNEGFTAGLKKAQGAIARLIMESLDDSNEISVDWLNEDYTSSTEDLEVRYPVYCWYKGQCKPQPAFIEIDPEADMQLSASYESEVGGRRYTSRVLHIFIPADAAAHNINQFIKDNMSDFQAIIDEYDFERGCFNDDVVELVEELQQTANFWETSDCWGRPTGDMVDSEGRLIFDYHHTIFITELNEDDGETEMEVEYTDPYGTPCGGSRWKYNSRTGEWELLEDNTAPCSPEATEVNAEEIREYLDEVYENNEIEVSLS